MNRFAHAAALAVFLVCVLAAVAVQASGGYMRDLDAPVAVDRQKYEVGRQLFAGTLALPPVGDAAVQAMQARVLKQWQARLPLAQQQAVDLPAQAGRLSPAQFDALAHYLSVRFKIDVTGG